MNNAILSLAAALLAFGAIDVPEETEAYHPIVAKVDAVIPDGASFDGGWDASEGVYLVPGGNGTVHIWAAPGSHSLAYSGFWLHLKEISFKDGDGNTITIQSYLGHGTINEKAQFTVLRGTEPDPPGPQPGAKQLVFFVQAETSEELPEGQLAILNSLTIRKDLASMGHVFAQVIDDDQIKEGVPAKWLPFVNAVMGDPLPRVAFASVGGGPVEDHPLPLNYNGLLEVLGEK